MIQLRVIPEPSPMRRHVLTALLLAASPASGQAPAPAPVFREQADLVVVDVVVADKHGNPVPGLRKEDFTVLDERAPQAIVSFEAVHTAATPVLAAEALPPRPRIVTNVEPPDRSGRTFTIVFDNVHLSAIHAYRAKQAVATFLEKGVRDGDRVSLLATGGGAWWSTRIPSGRRDLLALLKGLDGRRLRDAGTREQVTDFEAIRIHLYHDRMVGQRVARRFEQLGVTVRETDRAREMREIHLPGVNNPLVEARAAEAYQQVRRRLNITLAALERALGALAGNRGRKGLVVVSEGFVLDPNLDAFKRVVETARRSNVALYFVDTRGLEGLSSMFSAELMAPPDMRDYGAMWADTSQDAEGAEMLALDTGGFAVRNTNDIARGIERIARESESYYLVGYAPPPGPRDGRFRKIEVKVRGKGLVVRARKGYYAPQDGVVAAGAAPPPAPPFPGSDPPPSAGSPRKVDLDRDIQQALDSPFPVDGIRLRMIALVLDEAILGKARTMLAAEVDAAHLDFAQKDGRLVDTLDVLMVAANRDTGEYVRHDQKLDMAFQPATLERVRQSWYAITQDFELPSGSYQAKVVVRDGNSRKLGALTYEFEVPALSELRVSTPILTDSVRQLDGDRTPTPVLVVRRHFPPAGRLYCQFDVYGALKDKASGLPHVRATYEVRELGGPARERGGPLLLSATSLGRISQLLWVPLDGVPPGDYELVLTIRDELAAKEQQVREAFTVTAAERRAASSPAR